MNHVLRRRFMNIVSENCKNSTCSLRRLDVSEHLFYPSTAMAEVASKPSAAAISAMDDSLPAPIFSFQPEPRLRNLQQLFALVNPWSSESHILWSSPEDVTVVYDADTHRIHAKPSFPFFNGGCVEPVTISVSRPDTDADADADTAVPEQEDLYVLSSNASYPSFHVLPFGGRRTYKSPCRHSYKEKPWQWELLPPPPFPRDFSVTSHTLLDDGVTICITATCYNYDDIVAGDEEEESVLILTCLFNTVKREWWSDGGRWDLPFSGDAKCLQLWLGFSRDEHHLCAYDLLSQTPLMHLGEVVEMPKEWESIEANIINLGDGRFCVAKIIQEEWDDDDNPLLAGKVTMMALLTGVEMVRRGGGEFKMVTHKILELCLRQ